MANSLIYIPISPGGKKPLVSKWSDPSVTPEQAKAWWEHVPEDANKALRLDGLLVVDCDNVTAIEWWLTTGAPSDLRVKTPHGLHFYYRLDGVHEAPKAGALRFPDGRPMGVDIKTGNKHYVLVPPSVNAEGAPYRWV